MGLFDAIQDIIGGVTDSAQQSAQDITGSLGDNQIVQDLQDNATGAFEGAADAAAPVVEQGQTVIDDITQKFGL